MVVNIVGNWQLPGGHVEEDESHEDTLRREVREEADVELENIAPLGHLRVAEIKDSKIEPEFTQLYFVGKIKELNKQ